jgi:hypothetical protein
MPGLRTLLFLSRWIMRKDIRKILRPFWSICLKGQMIIESLGNAQLPITEIGGRELTHHTLPLGGEYDMVSKEEREDLNPFSEFLKRNFNSCKSSHVNPSQQQGRIELL